MRAVTPTLQLGSRRGPDNTGPRPPDRPRAAPPAVHRVPSPRRQGGARRWVLLAAALLLTIAAQPPAVAGGTPRAGYGGSDAL